MNQLEAYPEKLSETRLIPSTLRSFKLNSANHHRHNEMDL